MSDCVFCRIVAKDLPSSTVAESDLCLAFDDIKPAAPVHVLVIPKRHIQDAASLGDGDEAVVADMLSLARQAARVKCIDSSGYRLIVNVGRDAQCEVLHLHMHVLGGRRMNWPPA